MLFFFAIVMFYLPKYLHFVGNSFNKTKANNKWVMLVILIIFDVNKSHVTILSDLCIVAVVKYLHNLIKCFELSVDISCVNLNVDVVL